MPELPEVEHIARALATALVGRPVRAVTVRWPGAVTSWSPDAFAEALVGRSVSAVSRRGKYIALTLTPWVLLVHLRMTGRLLVTDGRSEEIEASRHTHVWLEMDGPCVYLHDVRKFGRLSLSHGPATALDRLGVEPLDDGFTSSELARRLRAHRSQIKPLLLDQHVVAGLGNIYVDESLWHAGLHPRRRSDSLTMDEVDRLHGSIRRTLNDAIAAGGTTVRDYRGADGEEGGYQFALAVYGREGEGCLRCGTAVERQVVAGRGTRLCPACQVAP